MDIMYLLGLLSGMIDVSPPTPQIKTHIQQDGSCSSGALWATRHSQREPLRGRATVRAVGTLTDGAQRGGKKPMFLRH